MLKKRSKNFSICDIAFIKWSVFFFAFFIASFIPKIISNYKWFWLALGVLIGIKPLIDFFKK